MHQLKHGLSTSGALQLECSSQTRLVNRLGTTSSSTYGYLLGINVRGRMRIAVSGMRGSLGRILYESLSTEGHSIVGLTRRAPPQWAEWRHGTTPTQHAAFKALEMWTLSSTARGGGLAGDKEAIFAANTHTTQHLVETVNQLRHPLLFIFVSSIAAGGPADLLGRPRTPSDQPNPISHYGHSKLAAETNSSGYHPSIELLPFDCRHATEATNTAGTNSSSMHDTA